MFQHNEDLLRRKSGQSSFSLIETIIALGLMVTIVLEVSAVQGRAINFSTYEREVTQATWLAKALMTHVEYKWLYYDIKDMKSELKDEKFPPEFCPDPCDFKFSLGIDEWKLPVIEMAAASLGDPTIAGIVKEQMKQILGDEILKVAHIEVTKGAGSRRDSLVELTYLITAQGKLDSTIEGLEPVGGTGTDTGTGTKTGTDTSTSTDTQQKTEKQGQKPPIINP